MFRGEIQRLWQDMVEDMELVDLVELEVGCFCLRSRLE